MLSGGCGHKYFNSISEAPYFMYMKINIYLKKCGVIFFLQGIFTNYKIWHTF